MQKDRECQCRYLPFSSEIVLTRTIELEAEIPQVLCNEEECLFYLFMHSPLVFYILGFVQLKTINSTVFLQAQEKKDLFSEKPLLTNTGTELL